MFTRNIHEVIGQIAELAPDLQSLNGPTKFFAWAETVVNVLTTVYVHADADEVLEDLVEKVKEVQEYE